MANILLTYDLKEDRLHESKHSQVKNSMKALGYYDAWTHNNVTYTLPNTTLFKDGSVSQAKAELLSCATAVVERFVAVEFSNWEAIKGEPYKS